VNANYRILTADYKIKFTGTDNPSWFTIEAAKSLVDYSKGEKIYEYNSKGERMWEIL
jgi:hypothetical protein